MNRTPGPWRQGKLLLTRNVKNMPLDWQRDAREREQHRVFANFSEVDEGRSRKFICTCQTKEDAAFIALCGQVADAVEGRGYSAGKTLKELVEILEYLEHMANECDSGGAQMALHCIKK